MKLKNSKMLNKFVERLLSPKDDNYKSYSILKPVCGLRNLGNTCYMNCIIQSLSNTNQIKNYCYYNQIDIEGKSGNKFIFKNSLIKAFIYLINSIWSGKYKIVTPLALKDIISQTYPQYGGKEPNDAHEFLLNLFDLLIIEFNKNNLPSNYSPKLELPKVNIKTYSLYNSYNSTESSSDQTSSSNSNSDMNEMINEKKKEEINLIENIFQGSLKKIIKCSNCKNEYEFFEPFFSLSIPIPNWNSNINHPISLESCLELFFDEEMIEDWFCEKCKMKTNSLLTTQIFKIPKVLIIHIIKPFQSSSYYNKQYIKFPLEDLILQTSPDHFYSFSLYSYINYYGNNKKGHYVCYNKIFNDWYCCDDETIYKYKCENKSDCIYLLFYKKN